MGLNELLMETIQTYLEWAVGSDCSDLFLIAGKAVSAQKDGELTPFDAQKLTPEESEGLIRELYRLTGLVLLLGTHPDIGDFRHFCNPPM